MALMGGSLGGMYGQYTPGRRPDKDLLLGAGAGVALSRGSDAAGWLKHRLFDQYQAEDEEFVP